MSLFKMDSMRQSSNMQLQRCFWHGSRLYNHVSETILRPLIKSPARFSAISFFLLLLLGAFFCTRLLHSPTILGISKHAYPQNPKGIPKRIIKKIVVPLDCTAYNLTKACPPYPTHINLDKDPNRSSPPACPEYFRWIHEDLRPWAYTGITREILERANRTATFRLVIVNGKAYVERYQKAFQTRDVFTFWGILQLLRKYPGKIPDLELMFDCVDWPVIKSVDYLRPDAPAAPPLFRYCGDDQTMDIVFPDWSFWGWPEINVKPWDPLLKDLKEGNKRTTWLKREPYAYWKGNPAVAETRQDLLKCNVSENQDWNARLYAQDWLKETKEGYKQSDLASQCNYRYKIYIEGSAWSVSEKYILACNSLALLVKPHYYDFFTRGLMPMYHYWPIKDNDKCRSIKFAVDWGNSHMQEAQAIGNTASKFIQEDLKMDVIYDYMFHLLSEYAKLLKFKPSVPRNAVEICAESMACSAEGLEKKFVMDSMVKGPADTEPCLMPPPYDPSSLHTFLSRKEKSMKQVEVWEKNFWDNQTNQS